MTSQVALLNPHGVALASDSAVSVGRKTFNTVNKIFPLICKQGSGKIEHPVAFMVSNSGTYIPGGMLWERVFDEFSKTQIKTHSSLEKYIEELINFLGTKNMFDKQQNNLWVQRLLIDWFNEHPLIRNHSLVTGALETIQWLPTSTEQLQQVFSDYPGIIEDMGQSLQNDINKLHNSINQFKDEELAKNFDDYSPIEVRIRKEHTRNSKVAAEELVDKLKLDSDYIDILTDIFTIHLSFIATHTPEEHTKIVAVGFGQDDHTPVMCEMVCGVHIDPDLPLITVKEYYKIRQSQTLEDRGELKSNIADGITHHDAGAIIRGFAQKIEMDNILNGFHIADMDHLRRKKNGVSEHMTNTILHQIYVFFKDQYSSNSNKPDELYEALLNHKWEFEQISERDDYSTVVDFKSYIHKELLEAIDDFGMVGRRQKFRQAVQHFPIPNLADFAHSLVRMESEICHWMQPIRSVGGPIDILTITKEDGCLLETRS